MSGRGLDGIICFRSMVNLFILVVEKVECIGFEVGVLVRWWEFVVVLF